MAFLLIFSISLLSFLFLLETPHGLLMAHAWGLSLSSAVLRLGAGARLPAGQEQTQPGSIPTCGAELIDAQITRFYFSGLKKSKPQAACALEGAVPLSLA